MRKGFCISEEELLIRTNLRVMNQKLCKLSIELLGLCMSDVINIDEKMEDVKAQMEKIESYSHKLWEIRDDDRREDGTSEEEV